MEILGETLKPWILGIGIVLFFTSILFIFMPQFTAMLNKYLDRAYSLRQFTRALETRVFDVDRWIIKNMKWLGIAALSDALILLGMYYIYLR